jgi:ParB-like chromosome segregation protein Spo0J
MAAGPRVESGVASGVRTPAGIHLIDGNHLPMTLSFAPERIETGRWRKLQPYAKNAKVHGADQVAKIAASMAEFGWTVPCLVGEDGELIAGHGRVLAATQLGLTEAPVIVLGHLTEAQRRAYRIADNRLAESPWNEELLSAELQDLLADDYDLSLVGFTDGELDKLLAFDPDGGGEEEGGAGGSVPPVTIPEPPRNPASRTGDLWILGDHRLLCGDSTSHEDVRRLMNGERAVLFAPTRHTSSTTTARTTRRETRTGVSPMA